MLVIMMSFIGVKKSYPMEKSQSRKGAISVSFSKGELLKAARSHEHEYAAEKEGIIAGMLNFIKENTTIDIGEITVIRNADGIYHLSFPVVYAIKPDAGPTYNDVMRSYFIATGASSQSKYYNFQAYGELRNPRDNDPKLYRHMWAWLKTKGLYFRVTFGGRVLNEPKDRIYVAKYYKNNLRYGWTNKYHIANERIVDFDISGITEEELKKATEIIVELVVE
jgi:hypothetical protein